MEVLRIFSIVVAIIITTIILLLIFWQVREHHLQDDPMLHNLRAKLEPYFAKDHFTGKLDSLNGRNIMKEIKVYRGDKSYTINKEKVYLCLKDENGKYYDSNLLTYVILHEITHVICPEIGHTDLFSEIFEELLIHASKSGIYDPTVPVDESYCLHGDKEV